MLLQEEKAATKVNEQRRTIDEHNFSIVTKKGVSMSI